VTMRVAVGGGSEDDRDALRGALLSNSAIEVDMLGRSVTVVAVRRLKPSLVVLVVGEPEQTIETACRIMAEAPTPIVLVAPSQPPASDEILARSGALAFFELPRDVAQRHRFVTSLQAMAEVKVVRRWRRDSAPFHTIPAAPATGAGPLVVIAASTGGPGALNEIFSELPAGFATPIIVVQHIADGFADNLVRSLSRTGLTVKLAQGGETLKPGVVYFAPDDRHLGVSSRNAITLSAAPPIEGFRPSATFLFESAAKAFGSHLTAVVLTWMGCDGVAGLRSVHECGGTIIAQDRESSIVFGMPKAAIESGFVDRVLPLSDIARELAAPRQRKGVSA
jgi:two-component system, chemotaxis family, protein-glutamate methylesterase/glutaminase